ncbi:MAG TPA: family 10 glycosylhydrolase [Verrucomicrobiota bacterium]|nr:family 10 glycosylhydrolase [Verrucomicrobiota bacterium]HNU51047.1 family 10 glycosylhydrolase [Verrucomicrobiota bacterium]
MRCSPQRHFGRAVLALAFALAIGTSATARSQEFRGLWVDAFHAGFKNSTEVRQLVADARAGHYNALLVEVRKRGDAYYDSLFEPKASDISPAYDPLADLIREAHNGTPRLEVHAWIVTFNIWNKETSLPPQETHPYRLHPDWLTKSATGATWDGSNYAFDPGHPEVQEHTVNVAMDLITRYDVDGLHWDYVRYAGKEWGYNDTAVARFNRATGSSGKPATDDSAWLQWRRDQVTGLVRRVTLSALAVKPALTISAATITWAPGGTTYSSWLTSAAYSDVLQDWRGWMEEGLLDLNVPMAYFRQHTHATAWANWSQFAKENRYGRHLALGTGAYLNLVSNTLVQMRSARNPTPTAPGAEGLVTYSYAVPASDATRAQFLEALTKPSAHDPQPTPVFATPAPPPAMPWKTTQRPTALKGIVRDQATGKPVEGAVLELCDPSPRQWIADANGFFGTLSAPAGSVTLLSSAAGFASVQRTLELPPGTVGTVDFFLSAPDAGLAPENVVVSAGTNSAWVSWETVRPASGQVLYGLGGICGPLGGVASDGAPDTRHAVLLDNLRPGADGDPSEYWLRIVTWDEQGTNVSKLLPCTPAWPVIRDDDQARFTGAWTWITNSSSSLGRAYRRASTTSGSTASAAFTWSATLGTTGLYDLAIRCPSGVSASTSAPYDISSHGESRTITVNQTAAAGQWRTVATSLYFIKGDRATVRLRNNTGASGSLVVADAVRWTFRPDQDPPPPGQTPEWWTRHFFGAGTTPPVDADADADGFDNVEEYVLGTDPTRASSCLDFRLEPAGSHDLQFQFHPLHAGRQYELVGAEALDTPGWSAVPEAVLGVLPDGKGVFTGVSPAPPLGFFRLKTRVLP